MTPSRLKRVQPLALVFVLLWQYCAGGTYPALSQVKPHSSARVDSFDELLGELKQVIRDAGAQAKVAPEKGFAGIERLRLVSEKLAAQHQQNRTDFERFARFIEEKKLPGEIAQRHAEFVRQYEEKYDALLVQLKSLRQPNRQALDAATSFVENNTRVRQKLDPNNLPHRSLRSQSPGAPKLTREEWRRAFPTKIADANLIVGPREKEASTTTADDLAENIEVKFTPEIRQLADSLDRNPVRIYNWVRNNIKFVPIWGSIQGAQLCLETRSCNAFDTASLLISLLRHSGVPARYQLGTIEVPVEKFKNWAGGFSNTEAAASLFASGGTPSVVRRVNQSGQVATVRTEHVWVRAFVDYAPSGGLKHQQGDTWIDLDASFKQYVVHTGVPLSAAGASDYRAFLDQLISRATVDPTTGSLTNFDRQALSTFIGQQAARVQNNIQTNLPDATAVEIFGGLQILEKSPVILPGALSYRVLARGNEVAQIPDSLRHKVTIGLGSNAHLPDILDQWSYTTSLPELAGKEATILYRPAADVDGQLLRAVAAAASISGEQDLVVPSAVQLIAQLYVGGELKVAGSALAAGRSIVSRIAFSAPTISLPPVSNVMLAGEHAVLGFDLQGMSTSELNRVGQSLGQLREKFRSGAFRTINSLDLTNAQLATGVLNWFDHMDKINSLTSDAAGVVTLRYPSVGMLFVKQRPRSFFGAAASISSDEINMDIDADVVVSVARDGNENKTAELLKSQGMLGSLLEAAMPGLLLSRPNEPLPGITTMDAHLLANDQQIPIFRINSENASTILPQLQISSADREEIEDALNASLVVTVPRQPVDFQGEAVLGIIMEDPRSGAASYLITGGTNGGIVEINKHAMNFAIMEPEIYAQHSTGFQTLMLSDDYLEFIEEAHEKFQDELVPEGRFRDLRCLEEAYVLAYLGQKLTDGSLSGQCFICHMAEGMGVEQYAIVTGCFAVGL